MKIGKLNFVWFGFRLMEWSVFVSADEVSLNMGPATIYWRRKGARR